MYEVCSDFNKLLLLNYTIGALLLFYVDPLNIIPVKPRIQYLPVSVVKKAGLPCMRVRAQFFGECRSGECDSLAQW